MDYNMIKEMISNRYFYLLENMHILLAPTLFSGKKDLDKEILYALEDLLLSDGLITDSFGYSYVESLKRHQEYLNLVLNSLIALQEYNQQYADFPRYQISMNILDILNQVYDYIDYDEVFNDTKVKKLKVLDEYFKIARYQNDGNIWNSGRYFKTSDSFNYPYDSNILAGELVKLSKGLDSSAKAPTCSYGKHILENAFINKACSYVLKEDDKYEISSIQKILKK